MLNKRTPLSWTALHPHFVVPQWSRLRHNRFHPQDASRHIAVFGETGAGKTSSVIIPFIDAALAYPLPDEYARYASTVEQQGKTPEAAADLQPALLVFDQKGELLDHIRARAKEGLFTRRLINLNTFEQNYILHYFARFRAEEKEATDVADRILSLSTYMMKEERNEHDPFWGKQGENLVKSFLAVNHALVQQGGVERLAAFWNMVQGKVVQHLNRKTLNSGYSYKHKAFEDVYTRFNGALEDIRAAAIDIEYSYKDGKAPEVFDGLYDIIGMFHAAKNDHERGRAFDALVSSCKEIEAWCDTALKEKKDGSRKNRDYLISFLKAAKRFTTIGETLITWAPPEENDMPDLAVSPSALPLHYDRLNYLRPLQVLLNLSAVHHRESPPSDPALEAYLAACRKYQVDLPQELLHIHSLMTMADRTYTSVIAVVNNILGELASPHLATHVSLNPYEAPPDDKALPVQALIEEGACVVYSAGEEQDRMSTVATLIGRCLKTAFFEGMFSRQNLARPFIYVCDEFQRFITSDPISGEQSFLALGRAWRGVCMVASQSVAALRHTLSTSNTGLGESASGHALQSLLSNLSTQMYFRSADLDTTNRLHLMIPEPSVPGKPHIIRVRPLSSLRVGECYYQFSDGTIGRGQIEL